MKITFSCFECNTSKEKDFKEYLFELRDDNTYQLTCEHGHESIIFFQPHKFELLFEMGVYAMLDGYYREAVSNFAACLERFHEFCIEVFIHNLFNKANTETSLEQLLTRLDKTKEYDKTWKMLSSSSERQLGAYTMLYLSIFLRAPELINRKNVEFRNDVIHKGFFPTEEKTMSYAIDVLNYLKTKIIELKENMDEYVEYVYERKLREYISGEEIAGKHIVNWAELMTLKTLTPVTEIKALNFETVLNDRKHGYKPFKK
jgi:hypothetical protein